jgi:PHD/YefM family antitoxin component YafN of YafNO toxin-antitoxin module
MQAMTLNEAVQDLLNVIDKVNDNHEPLVVTHEHHM